VPVDTLLRLLYLKHRYGLGYETLCREVSDSISWRRFCRIGLDRPVPHPTTLVKLVRRAGPEVVDELNAALVAKLAAGKLLRARKLRVDTTVVEADIDYPTDADLLEHAVRKLGGLVRRVKARGAASRTRFRDRGRAAGRRMKQLARTLRRRSGVAMGEVDRLTGEVAAIARRTLREVQVVAGNARRAGARRSGDGRLGRLVGELAETIAATRWLLAQTDQRLAGNRVIPDRLVSLSDPDARPIRKGKPGTRPSSATPCCWPRRNAGSSPITSCNRATHPTPRSWSRRSSASSRSPAGRPGRWLATAASGPPPTTRRWKRSGSSGSGCNAPAPRQGAAGGGADPAVPAAALLAGRDRGPHQPPQARLRAAPHQAAAAAGRLHLGRAGHLRLQPPAHDRGRAITPVRAGRQPPASRPSLTHPDQAFFRGK
jgi:IS5 family transposase